MAQLSGTEIVEWVKMLLSRRWIARGLLLGGVIAIGAVVTAIAAASGPSKGVDHVSPRVWRAFGTAYTVWATDRYVYEETSAAPERGVVINDKTRRRKAVRVGRGCAPVAIGGIYMLFNCGLRDSTELKVYRLAAPQGWLRLPSSAAIADACTSAYESCVPIAVGDDWIEYDGQVCQDGEHCVDHYEFENIATGRVADDPATPGGTTYPDLNAAGLARTLCRPLRVPTSYSDGGTQEPGMLTFYGKFAIAETDDVEGDGNTTSLERCGTAHARLLQGAVPGLTPAVGSTRAIVWTSNTSRISGIYLPSGKPFAFKIPVYNPLDSGAQLAVTSTTVLVVGDGTVWARTLR